MSETKEAAPRPWRRQDTRDYAEIIAADGSNVAMVARADDADLLVQSVNDSASLLKRHEALRVALQECRSEASYSKHERESDRRILDIVDDALRQDEEAASGAARVRP
jgi:hypothetical protein